MSSSSSTRKPLTKEHQLVSKLIEFLKSENYRVRLEVPNLGQSVDLVATRGRWVTLIEVKIHDWRTAIKQCRAHEHVADFICIAVGTNTVSETACREVENLGYGLIHYTGNGQFSWILQPERNRLLWKPQRGKLSLALREIEYEN